MGGRGPAHAPQCFWCCQDCFNISKGRHFDEAEGIPAFINGSQAINAPMPSVWIIYRFAFFFPSPSPVAHLLFDVLQRWQRGGNTSTDGASVSIAEGGLSFLNMHFNARFVCGKHIWEQMLIRRVKTLTHLQFTIYSLHLNVYFLVFYESRAPID